MHKYTFLQKKLHKLCLKNNIIKKSLFEIEKILFFKKDKINNENHIFITGLPRSGTTTLLYFLYKSNKYASLTYKDMPFILSPNLLSKFYKSDEIDFRERMHEDGIKYNQDSPEAFEEVFFLTFDEKEYKENFTKYVSLILKKYQKESYLSKNNNNYKRIDLLELMFSNSNFLIPFRDPLQHANSLLLQHIHFLHQQKEDNFILDYMNYLGHFEFGLNHKSWFMPNKFKKFDDLNYWIEQWYLFYSNLIKRYISNPNVFFVSYEKLCNEESSKNILIDKFNLQKNIDFKFNLSKKEIKNKYDSSLISECLKVYEIMTNKSLI